MNMPEYMRVRMYLYNQIAKSDGKELQIPSENDLCRLFEVSRITVRGAIQGLVRDKYLIPQRGIGTFMNPEKISQGTMKTPTVAVIIGAGRNVTNPFDITIADCIFQSGMKFETLFLPDSDSPARLVEIVKSGIDAVIWLYPQYVPENVKYLNALHAAGIPLLAIETDHPASDEIDNIISDPAQRGSSLAEYLFCRGHRNMLFVHNFPVSKVKTILDKGSPHWFYCRKMKELNGGKEPETGVVSLLELEEKLRSSPDFISSFSTIYSVAEAAPYVMEVLDQARITVPARISYLIYGKSDPYFFHGLKPDHVDNGTQLRQAVFEWLELRLRRNCRDGRFERQWNMKIIPGETVLSRTFAKQKLKA